MTKKVHLTLGAGLALMLAATEPVFAEDKCALTEIASLPISETANGMATIPLTVGGTTEPFVLAIDQPYSALTEAFIGDNDFAFRQFGSGDLRLIKIMGRDAQGKAYVPQLDVGHAAIHDVQMLGIEDSVAPGTVGIVGLDVLSNFGVELNLEARKLNLFSRDHCPGRVVYWNRPFSVLPILSDDVGNPYFQLQLENKSVTAKLSVSQDESAISGPAAGTLSATASFQKLSLNEIAIGNLPVHVYPQSSSASCNAPPLCFGGTDLILGRHELRRLRLFFDFKEKQLYVTAGDPASAAMAQPPARH